MTWKEWRALFQFRHLVNRDQISITVLTPYLGIRVMYHAVGHRYPQRESGLIFAWRWPGTSSFKETGWKTVSGEDVLILFPAMDMAYMGRAMAGINANSSHVLPTIKELVKMHPPCDHPGWVYTCHACAKKALALAINRGSQLEDERKEWMLKESELMNEIAEKGK
jgi:hypothetical protein